MSGIVEEKERLSRFILHSSWIRKIDLTIKPEAYYPRPHPHLDLSVTRSSDLSEEEIWEIGVGAALPRKLTLFGRGDCTTKVVFDKNLDVIPDPTPMNKYHANITGWPAGKPDQKLLALEIAAVAGKIKYAPGSRVDD